MLRETCSCFSFTGTQGLMAASSQLSEAPLGPSETARGIDSGRRQCKASKYQNYRGSDPSCLNSIRSSSRLYEKNQKKNLPEMRTNGLESKTIDFFFFPRYISW